jgi:D-glycero-alpha-D-manno-heptose-7-phosphate kinase
VNLNSNMENRKSKIENRKSLRARAPLRLGFGGGGTDVAPFSEEHGGHVLNATIDRYAYATLVPRDDDRITLRSLDLDQEISFRLGEEVPTDTHELALAKGVIRRLAEDRLDTGFTLYTHTDCPPGSGLGASSTVVVALIGVLDRWLQLGLGRYEAARLAFEIERLDLGIQGGKQDQYAASFGGFNFMEFGPEGRVIINPLRVPPEWTSELEYALVLAFSGKSRSSSDIIADQIDNAEAKREKPLRAMRRTKELATSMKHALLRGQFRAFGELLHEAWGVKKQMSAKISTPQIEKLYEAAREAGALGGKVSGAGGGGFMFFFTDFDRRHHVERALAQRGADVVHFGFTNAGLETWVR